MPDSGHIHQLTAHLFRQESGKMLAVLTRLFGTGQTQLAEDIVQETLIAALENWKTNGIPDNPRAWLYRVARNKTTDLLRRERNFRERIAPNISIALDAEQATGQWMEPMFLDHEIEDSMLRMMFVCCHPTLSPDSQIALILKTLGGLSVREISSGLMVSDEVIAKRIYRAREKIAAEKIELNTPATTEIAQRTQTVMQALYLLFTEGYKSSSAQQTEQSIRHDFCLEAIRLCQLLTKHEGTHLPSVHALLALMCFQAAKFDARFDTETGKTITLQYQDRNRWNRPLINVAYKHFDLSSTGDELSEYHLEAAIASYHACAATFEQTNWNAILYCYNLLVRMDNSPNTALNRAIACGYARGASAGITALQALPNMQQNATWHAAQADFYAQQSDFDAARASLIAALNVCTMVADREVLQEKLERLGE